MESYNSDSEFFEEFFPDDAKTYQQKQQVAEGDQDRLRLAMLALLNLEQGRDFLFHLLNQTGVFAPTFTGNSTMYWLEGRRAVGLEIYKLILRADPDSGLQKLINHGREIHALKNLKE